MAFDLEHRNEMVVDPLGIAASPLSSSVLLVLIAVAILFALESLLAASWTNAAANEGQ